MSKQQPNTFVNLAFSFPFKFLKCHAIQSIVAQKFLLSHHVTRNKSFGFGLITILSRIKCKGKIVIMRHEFIQIKKKKEITSTHTILVNHEMMIGKEC